MAEKENKFIIGGKDLQKNKDFFVTAIVLTEGLEIELIKYSLMQKRALKFSYSMAELICEEINRREHRYYTIKKLKKYLHGFRFVN
jgi:hypothetical protein